ncbi:MAG: MBL fold metallo-hydrolase [Myxococcales bacterium]|nr:MBL fold metallo-hydrolase [Myxococcales bacterium]MCB9705915.1 MBL fold metallo-hydrolase [Myxococcales bacterium]
MHPKRSLGAWALALTCAACSSASERPAPPMEAGPLYASNNPGAIVSHLPLNDDVGDTMRMHFIDIGQGDATLLEFPCGAVLIDTGGEQNESFDSDQALRDYLDAFFARRPDLDRTIDLLLITHPHIDHMRSVMTVLETYRVRNVVDNGMTDAEHHDDAHEDPGAEQQVRMHEWLAAHPEVGHLDVKASDITTDQGLVNEIIDPVGACGASTIDPKITVLWGAVTEEIASYGLNPNNHSVVARVDFGKSSAMFTGDLELVGLSRLASKYNRNREIFDVDVYQVGHHGSKNATIHYMMEMMSPTLAVISMGPYERIHPWTARKYGHPNIIALEHLVHPKHGVLGWREKPIEAWVGIKGAWKDERQEVFERRTISKAIYATGWEGTVVVSAGASGQLAVDTER